MPLMESRKGEQKRRVAEVREAEEELGRGEGKQKRRVAEVRGAQEESGRGEVSRRGEWQRWPVGSEIRISMYLAKREAINFLLYCYENKPDLSIQSDLSGR